MAVQKKTEEQIRIKKLEENVNKLILSNQKLTAQAQVLTRENRRHHQKISQLELKIKEIAARVKVQH